MVLTKISVIIPTYNRENYLREAIDSVLEQTYQDFEIIIVDDGSSDNTKDLVASYILRYKQKIRYFYQKNKGQSAAINIGIRESNGEYIAFLDSDDIWLPQKIEKYLQLFEENPEISLIAGRMQVIDGQGNYKIGVLKPKIIPGNDVRSLLEQGSCSTSSIMAKRCVFENILFDENLLKVADLDFTIRVARGYKILNIDDALTLYREHEINSLHNVEISLINQIKFWEKARKEYRNAVKDKLYLQKLAELNYLLSVEYFKKNKFRLSRSKCMEALRRNHFLGKIFWTKKDSYLSKVFKLIKPYGLFFINIFLSIFQLNKTNKELAILFYEPSSGFGGSAGMLANIMDYLTAEKFRSTIVIKNFGMQIEKIKKGEIIRLKNYKGILRIIYEVVDLVSIIRTKKISLVHINTNIITGIPAILAAKLTGKPCICHLRETRKLIKRERLFAKWIDKFIVLNNDAHEIYSKDIAADKINLIYDGINTCEKVLKGNFRQEFNLNSNSLIGVIGRVIEGKGQKEFILAAKEVLKIRPSTKFVIVGEAKGGIDNYYNEVKELVKSERLDKNIIFTGWRNDVNSIIVDLDIIVQSTTTFPEGFGLTCIEAMTLEKPVIATKVPGPSDIVVDGKTGFLVPMGDIKAMAEKMIYLLDNPDVARKMGEAGKKRTEELFDIKKQVKKVEAIYEELLNRR
ncbi:MAG: glycosyltransferase [Candidatus Omnitrophota bacterium]